MSKNQSKTTKKAVGILAVVLMIALAGIPTIMADSPQSPGIIYQFLGTTTVVLNATDTQSGVNHTYYEVWYRSTGNGQWSLLTNWTVYAAPFNESANGFYQVHYYSVDKAGNAEGVKFKDLQVIVDTTAPSTTCTFIGKPLPN